MYLCLYVCNIKLVSHFLAYKILKLSRIYKYLLNLSLKRVLSFYQLALHSLDKQEKPKPKASIQFKIAKTLTAQLTRVLPPFWGYVDIHPKEISHLDATPSGKAGAANTCHSAEIKLVGFPTSQRLTTADQRYLSCSTGYSSPCNLVTGEAALGIKSLLWRNRGKGDQR